MAGVHSSLGPSGAHRFTRCTAAPQMEAGIVDDPTEFAAEGTVYHEMVAYCTEFGFEPRDFFEQVWEADGFKIEIDEDMVRHGSKVLETIRELPEPWYIEQWVSTAEFLGPGQGGTLDLGSINWSEKQVTILDHKYGAGIRVYAEDNEQLMLYLCGFWSSIVVPEADRLGVSLHLADWKVRIIISQPRIVAGGGEWWTTVDRCREFATHAGEKAEETRTNPTFNPGPYQCFFCKARKSPSGCDAYTRFNLDTIGLAFDDIDEGITSGAPPVLDNPASLTPERRSYIHLHGEMFEKFLKQIRDSALKDALAGRPAPGLKVVAGRQPARKYKPDTEEAVTELLVDVLGDAAYVKKLLSPTQAEIKIGPAAYARLEKYVDRGKAGVALVPEGNRKEALATHAEQFTDDDVI